jgi:hypothetical protein
MLNFDESYLVQRLTALARVPTEVPLGFDTLMEPNDPKLVFYVQSILRPELVNLGYLELLDAPDNNLVVSVGQATTDACLLILNYTPAQHHNLMPEPFSGKVAIPLEYGSAEPSVYGQGVSQGKVHQAVMLTVLKALRDAGLALRGKLLWAVNNEGMSSHRCSRAIQSVLPKRPSFALIQIPTDFKLSLGNRGRVDLEIRVTGLPAHSSEPDAGRSAILGFCEAVDRIRALDWPDVHPLLGKRHAITYKVKFEPLAPHTLPGIADMTVDRRLLPGDSIPTSVKEIADVLTGMAFDVSVGAGPSMLPALVDPELPWVLALDHAHKTVTGRDPEHVYVASTFDAGVWCDSGTPTVMYGAGGKGDWPVGPDFVSISDALVEAQVIGQLITDRLL